MTTMQLRPGDPTPMTDSSSSSSITDLTQARRDRAQKLPNGQPCPLWMTYDPPKPYLLLPCRVIYLPVKD